MTAPLIAPELVVLDADLGSTKEEVIRSLAGTVAATGRADVDGLVAAVLEREAKTPTGMPGGFAIPHGRSEAVREGAIAVARLTRPVDFGDKNGPADIIIMLTAAADAGSEHMRLLTALARALVKPGFLDALRSAATPEEVVTLVDGVLTPDATAPAAGAATPGVTAPEQHRRIVGVTACATGIAHTYMAADYLTNAGKEMGIDVIIEPQGSGPTQWLDQSVIDAADAVIFATDVGVKERGRFAGKPVIESGVKRGIDEPRAMIEEALAAADDPRAYREPAGAATSEGASTQSGVSLGRRVQKALMTGVSYMIPFVAAGGLLIALGFLTAGYQIPFVADHVLTQYSLTHLPQLAEVASAVDKTGAPLFSAAQTDALTHVPFLLYLGAALFKLGGLAFGFLVPALAGYIAFGIADRPGIAPGFVAGALAGFIGAGFLGGLVGGVIAGLIAHWIASWKVPTWMRGLMPVLVVPLLATMVTGLLMVFVLGRPLVALMDAMTKGLASMNGSSAIMLGIVLGLMMCFDLGGPVNKVAYLFATAGLDMSNPASMKVMAAVMAAGMVPPLALALSTALRPRLYTQAERENGKAAWLLGASFISEGAIPFAAADPLRVIPSMMAGGAVTGAISMAAGATSRAPHGGVFVLFAMSNQLMWIVSILAGTVVAGLLVTFLKDLSARSTKAAA